MKRKILIILIAIIIITSLICVLYTQRKQNRLPSAQLQSTANEIADTLVSQYDVASVQYALIDNSKFILSGSKSGSDGETITKDTMYGIGSVSKMYVSAASMMLVDRGLLDLDEPLVTYIPEFEMADQRYKQITPCLLYTSPSPRDCS